ncbi:ATP-binding protein [Streptomyces rugosispiralis]|uniref:ATP-binding protein n=1 Tax=Streptomyces rugosispiralis TaxID=2967341 RepID=A0ABT1V9X8_9ACTN|nr:ATP-binding protein [Streptomyces rugosispiralis]MCQ8194091.1 ATP-binding protein [Streptomyces rugosispiralis]
MYHYAVTEPRPRRCVLPFNAEAPQVADLRRAVRAELAAWGMLTLVDEAQLIVTELASNVIKHVGQGTAATLVLDADADQLRVELHDISHKEPQSLHPTSEEESGRGLQLLADLSTAWGTTRTAVGKAVWCELRIVRDESRRRIQRATVVMEAYGHTVGSPAARLTRCPVLEESVTSLILDLLHWLTAHGLDPDDILDRAQTHFESGLNAVG